MYGEGAPEPEPDRLQAVVTAFSEYATLTESLMRDFFEMLPQMIGGFGGG